MSNEKLDNIVYPDESFGEAALQVAKTGSDIICFFEPILGLSTGKIIDYTLNSMRDKRVRELVDSIKKYLEEMPEDILQSEEFAETIKMAYSHYINEASEEKRKLLLNMYKSALTLLPSDRKSTFNLLLVFDDLFKLLSLPSLLALMEIECQISRGSTKNTIIKYLSESQGIHYMRCFSELVSHSLLEEEFEIQLDSFNRKPPKVVDEHDKKYHISPLGSLFLAWLKHKLDYNTA